MQQHRFVLAATTARTAVVRAQEKNAENRDGHLTAW